jgi:precorrin-6x reductase
MSAGTHPRSEIPDPLDAEDARQRALLHMLEAIKLLDDAKHPYAAAHLQHAIDVLRKKPPHQH